MNIVKGVAATVAFVGIGLGIRHVLRKKKSANQLLFTPTAIQNVGFGQNGSVQFTLDIHVENPTRDNFKLNIETIRILDAQGKVTAYTRAYDISIPAGRFSVLQNIPISIRSTNIVSSLFSFIKNPTNPQEVLAQAARKIQITGRMNGIAFTIEKPLGPIAQR